MTRSKNIRVFHNSIDARQKINASLLQKDARHVIQSNRRKRIVDARGLISANRKKNVNDARSIIINRQLLLSKKERTMAMPKRTVKNDLYVGAGPSDNRRNQSLFASMFSRKNVKREPVEKASYSTGLMSRPRTSTSRPVNMTITRDLSPEYNQTPLPSKSASQAVGVSPLQGFKLQIRNLHSSVSVDDLHELFSSLGHLRQCRLIRPGFGEVVYNNREEAISAINQYNTRELDGQPMSVQLVTSGSPIAAAVQRRNKPFANHDEEPQMDVEYETVTKALFNLSSQPNVRRPVNFVVNM